MAYENEIAELLDQARELVDKAGQLREKAEELKNKAAKEKEEKVGLLWRPEKNGRFYTITQSVGRGDLYVNTSSLFNLNGALCDSKVPIFRTEEQAKAFAEAFQVMLELRSQPGIIKADDSKSGSCVIYHLPHDKLEEGGYQFYVGTVLSPRFRNADMLWAAVRAVGEDRIKKAFKTLMFID